jgi:tetratricopeptide (TPR) repeat protein
MDKLDASDVLDSAIALHEAGRVGEAEKLYLQILECDPNEPDALNLLGVILQERGELARSIELISRALKIEPNFPEALTNLARAQRAAGEPALAAEHARRAAALDPNLPEAALILCRAMLDLGDPQAAVEAGRQAVALAPASFDAHSYLGLAHENLKNWRAAAVAYRAALDLEPGRVTMQVTLGSVLSESGQYDSAIRLLRQAATAAPNELPPYVALGLALQRSQDIAESIVVFRRALELAPFRADIWRIQGGNFDAIGQFDEAARCYNQSLELDPGSAEARRSLAKIGRLGNDPAEVDRLTTVLGNVDAPIWDRIAAGFALGTQFDKDRSYDRAFAAFETANQLAKAHYATQGEVFDARLLRRDVESHILGFDPAALAIGRLNGHASEVPVFVVGMPRSGTTLVEQIAASHPRVHGVGETMDVHDIVVRLRNRQPGVHPVLWDQAAIRREATAHLERLRTVAGDADRVVDKLPDNVLAVGHIAVLFPRARVIICRRDLRDVGLSCYFQHFNDPTTWSFDLLDCGARAREITRLMDYWTMVRPLRILEVHYEQLVGDLEGQSRRLIDFLGLEWDRACLDFHKTERKVMSASQWQVRQPLYSSSVGRWRHYRHHLGTLFEGLGDYVQDDARAIV